jgi:hypothetical protein
VTLPPSSLLHAQQGASLDHVYHRPYTRDQEAAKQRIVESLRAIWPPVYHRNIGKAALAYFSATFPIREEDRQLLVERYILPIIEP